MARLPALRGNRNAPSIRAAVPSPSVTAGGAEVKLVVVVDELGRVVRLVVSVIEAVLPNVERPRVLLHLLQLLDDRRPHLLRDNSTHRLTDPAQLDLQLQDVDWEDPVLDCGRLV